MNKRVYLAVCMAVLLSIGPQIAGASYEEGEAANREGNRETAFSAFKQAARQGDVRAFGKLAAMYLYGVGTTKSYSNAYIWFSLAEENGDRLAERYRMAASSAMSREQLEWAQQQLEEKQKELEIRNLPSLK